MTEKLGRKFDQGKSRWDLVPWTQFKQVVDILTFGSMKYEDNNWQHVEGGRERYFRAMVSHAMDYRIACETNQPHLKNDPLQDEFGNAGSGKSHLAHVICNALFLMWFDEQESTGKSDKRSKIQKDLAVNFGLSKEDFDNLEEMGDEKPLSTELEGYDDFTSNTEQAFDGAIQKLDILLDDLDDQEKAIDKKIDSEIKSAERNVDPMVQVQKDLVANGVSFQDLPVSNAEPLKMPKLDIYDPTKPIKNNSEEIFSKVEEEKMMGLDKEKSLDWDNDENPSVEVDLKTVSTVKLLEMADATYPVRLIDGKVTPIPKWACQNAVLSGELEQLDQRYEAQRILEERENRNKS